MATLTRDHFDCNLFTHHHFAIDTLSHQPRCLKVPLHDISKQTTHPAHRRSRKFSQHLMQTLHQVNSEIKELEDRLAALYDVRKKLQGTAQGLQNGRSAVQTLPEDILREVFIRCVPEDRFPALHVADAPLLLTIICRK